MALSRAIAATGETVSKTERLVTSALTIPVKVFLPEIAAGASATVAAGFSTRIVALSTGTIEVVDFIGKRVALVGGYGAIQVQAKGDANFNFWTVAPLQLSSTDLAKAAAADVTPTAETLEVWNATGSPIAVDKIVAVTTQDVDSGLPKVVLADADVAAHDNLWVTTAAIADGASGFVTKRAISAANLNTNSVTTAGDLVYLSTTAGAFTHTPPTGANARNIPVGFATVKDATVGQIQWMLDDDARMIGTDEIQAKAVKYAQANVFISTEQTGTGSSQNVAHGLGAAPAKVLVCVTEHPGTPDTGAFDVAEGAHDGTNVVVTVTTNVKFKVMAWV